MSFYQSISGVYERIFPLKPEQVGFVNRMFPRAGDQTLLDVGCGTGLLCQALSASFKKVVGIDLDEAMLAQARAASDLPGSLDYMQADMMDLDQHFEPGSFDCLVCFGNTLVHLPSLSSISEFCRKSSDLLRSKGKLLIQIINYDRILDQQLNSLPSIENEEVKFIRNYRYLEEKHRIEFETILTLKQTMQVIPNKVSLYPLRQSEMEACLENAGFETFCFYGNFKGDPLIAASIPMVIEAGKA